MAGRIWVTWETQRRNVTLSAELDARLHVFDTGRKGWGRYLTCLCKTAGVYREQKPGIIFVQNPSMILALFSVLYGKVFRVPVIIDAHNAGLFPCEGKKAWANRLAASIVKLATVTIVTNEPLAFHVEEMGGKPFVLPDPLPNLKVAEGNGMRLKGKHNVLYVCTYAEDEPYADVINAGHLVGEEVCIYVTGDPKKCHGKLPATIPGNVILTGFLPEEEYVKMLAAAELVVVLTRREDCLLCGAYEAVSLGKPLITSDRRVLREYFHKGAAYTDNSAADLAEKIRTCIDHHDRMSAEAKSLKIEITESWKVRKSRFLRVLERMTKEKHRNPP
jgi:glycosyltransferase involved in cell wall biosynthesis